MNGDVVDCIDLFDLDLSEATVSKSKRGVLRIKNVGVALSVLAATTLSAVFGVNAFVEGFPIGNADVTTLAFRIAHDDDDEDEEDDDDDD